MNIEIRIQNTPLHLPAQIICECGAIARFDGIVRGKENGLSIKGLHYQAYQPMAERSITQILATLHESFPFSFARVHHRVGWVPVGEAAICVEVHSCHRAEAFAVLTRFLDVLKQEVPIWKSLTL